MAWVGRRMGVVRKMVGVGRGVAPKCWICQALCGKMVWNNNKASASAPRTLAERFRAFIVRIYICVCGCMWVLARTGKELWGCHIRLTAVSVFIAVYANSYVGVTAVVAAAGSHTKRHWNPYIDLVYFFLLLLSSSLCKWHEMEKLRIIWRAYKFIAIAAHIYIHKIDRRYSNKNKIHQSEKNKRKLLCTFRREKFVRNVAVGRCVTSHKWLLRGIDLNDGTNVHEIYYLPVAKGTKEGMKKFSVA